jgi:hypothetical protein
MDTTMELAILILTIGEGQPTEVPRLTRTVAPEDRFDPTIHSPTRRNES